MIPSVGVGVAAGDAVVEHHRRAVDATELAAEVEDAAAALDALVLTSREVRLAELTVQARRFGLAPDAAGELLGIDLADDLRGVRDRGRGNPVLERLVAEAGGESRLARARAAVDRGFDDADPDVIDDISSAARDLWQQELSDVVARSQVVALEPHLRRALEAFQASAELFRVSHRQLAAAVFTIVPTLYDSPTDLDPGVVAGQYDAALARTESVVDEHTARELRTVIEDDTFAAAVARLSPAGDPVEGAVDIGSVAAVFRAGLERDASVERLTEAASHDAKEHAVSVGDAARAAYHRTLAASAGLLLVTVVLAMAVASSIARPLRRLARRAAEVSDGDLGGDPLGPSGPRETAVLASTLDEAVQNLRAVEGRMAALAAGDLDAAADSPPGKLGALVARSVEGLARSIAERERLQHRLAHEASHDALTGLANRRTAMAALQASLASGRPVGLLFLDLDGFKAVNDEQGHAVGDALLKVAAQRLRHVAPEGALVARLGGDEFVVATDVETDDDAVALAETITRLLDEHALVSGLRQRIAVSVGVAVSRTGDDADRLLRSADAALYEAKRTGRGGVVLLDDDLRASIEEEHQLEVDLRQAIDGGELEVHYQPLFEAAGPLHGVEALVRWRRGGELVPPDRFIPAAERNGLVVDLDRWVLDRALRQIGRWRRGVFPGLRLSVNVSARTLLSSHLVADVEAALDRTEVEGVALMLEVTETALLHDLETAAAHITELRALGVGTSVDDFGTGYTSVAHLRRLPVVEVKIDRSFVQAMGDDERDRMLVDLVTRIGSVLSLDVVAEGVETEEQLDQLRVLGCRFAQGFLLGGPLPPDELERLHAVPAASTAAR